jgi:hypothetical protein
MPIAIDVIEVGMTREEIAAIGATMDGVELT